MASLTSSYAWGLLPVLVLHGWLSLTTPPVLAQITPDNTLGTESSRVRAVNNRRNVIEGGAVRGAHLFHSFDEFNVGQGRAAYFASPVGTLNIFSRVTGNNSSNILGTLGVDGTANLYLLNPNGIVFGPNAKLDIRGSFIATTANEFTFLDGREFSAVDPQSPPLLTVSIIPGLQYGAVGGDIDNQGRLYAGQNLTLNAENLNLQGQVAAGGDLTLLATDTLQIRDAAEVPFMALAGGNLLMQGNEQVDIVALSHPDSGLYAYGNMVLRSTSAVGGDTHYWSAGGFRVETLDGNVGSLVSPVDPIIRTSGDVEIGLYVGSSLHILAGGSVTIGTATITAPELGTFGIDALQEDIALSNGTVVQVDGIIQPTLDIRAGVSPILLGTPPPEVLTGFDPTTDFFFIQNSPINTNPSAADIEVGDVWIAAPNGLVLLTNQYERNPEILDGSIFVTGEGIYGDGIDARGYGSQGGTVLLDSGENVEVNSTIRTDTFDSGVGGDITVLAEEVVRFNEAHLNVFTDGVGNAGNVIINGESLEINNSILNAGTSIQEENGRADAGNIRINVEESVDLNNTLLSVSTSSGNAGHISINAGRDIFLRTSDPENSFDNTRTVISGQVFQSGSPGSIHITAGEDIELTSDVSYICLFGCLVISSGFSGEGGDNGAVGEVIFDAGNNISLVDTSSLENLRVSTSTSGVGDAGNITLQANGDVVLDGSSVFSAVQNESDFTAPARGNGGNIFVGAHSVSLRNRASLQTLVDGVEGDFDAGQGNAGNVVIRTTDHFEMSGASEINSSIQQGATGNGGDIDIEARVLNITDASSLQVQTFGNGNAGTITIRSQDRVSLDNSNIFSDVNRGAVGDGGNIKISTSSLSAINNTQLRTATAGDGDAGDVIIEARSYASLSDSDTAVFRNTGNQSFNVNISSTGNLMFTDSSFLSNADATNPARNFTTTSAGWITFNNSSINTNTQDLSQAGEIHVEADQGIVLTGEGSRLLAQTSAAGTAGNINITAPQVALEQGAQVSTSTTNSGTAGNIIFDTNTLTLSDGASITAETSGTGQGGSFTLDDIHQITVSNGGSISASASSTGAGGSLIITTPNALEINGRGHLSAGTSSTGASGSIAVTAQQLLLDNGVTVSALNTDATRTGNITLNAEDLTIQNGARVVTNTSGSGDAGDIKFNVSNILDINNATVAASTEAGSTGNGGDINIDPMLTLIRNGGSIAVNSAGQGQGGNIFLTSDNLFLDHGSITAETLTSNGGNIALDIQTLLFMDNLSLISASAGTAQAGGDGGNIAISIPDGFLIAPMGADSDIVAQAYEGTGGNIDITARGIYGFVEQPAVRGNSTNDIDASSQFGQSGTVSINDLLVDPSQDVVELPTNVLEAERLIDRSCQVSSRQKLSRFVFIGRGGLPPTPEESIRNTSEFLDDLGPLVQTIESQELSSLSSLNHDHDHDHAVESSSTVSYPIVEAQMWSRNANGQIVLQAHVASTNVERMKVFTMTCQ